MSDDGYIYVKNWDRFQHYRNRRPPWIKLYVELLNDDEYLSLSPSDRCLLQACWMAAAEYGNGRARADQSTLRARAKVPKGNLESLVQAGFVEVRASKPLAPEREKEKEAEKEPLDLSRNRSSRAQSTASTNGTQPAPELPAALARILDAKIAATLTPAQTTIVGRAWFCSTELRHSLASVEAADNPTAMLVSISQRIIRAGAP